MTGTLTTKDPGGKTQVTAHSLFANKEDRDGILATGMESGANESWDRVEELFGTL